MIPVFVEQPDYDADIHPARRRRSLPMRSTSGSRPVIAAAILASSTWLNRRSQKRRALSSTTTPREHHVVALPSHEVHGALGDEYD
jgi:hypothetical protein